MLWGVYRVVLGKHTQVAQDEADWFWNVSNGLYMELAYVRGNFSYHIHEKFTILIVMATVCLWY